MKNLKQLEDICEAATTYTYIRRKVHSGRYSISEERWKVLSGEKGRGAYALGWRTFKYGVSEMPNLRLCGYFSSLKSLANDSFAPHSQNEKTATVLVKVPRSRGVKTVQSTLILSGLT